MTTWIETLRTVPRDRWIDQASGTTWCESLVKRFIAVAALMACGCGIPLQPMPSPQPNPRPNDPQTVILKITVDGEGKVNVGGNATITARTGSSSPADAVCDCSCGLTNCDCRNAVRRTSSAVRPDAPSGLQSAFTPRTERRYVCENGVCGWVDVAVAAPRSSNRIRVYYQPGNPASEAMRRDLGDSVDWVSGGQPPTINGNRWWPTAVKPDGSAWSPAEAGWSAPTWASFNAWAR